MRTAPAPYRAIALTAFRHALARRSQIAWSWAGSLIYLSIALALWTGVYRYTAGAPAGLSLQDVTTYTVILHLTYAVVAAGWESPKLLRQKIRQGTVAADLLRPVPLPLAMAADCAGRALYGVVYSLPGLLLIGLLRPSAPAGALAGALFPLSLLAGLVVNFEIHLLVRMAGFWLRDTHGAYWLIRGLNEILGGEVFPIWFLPGPLRTLALWLPFQAIASTPYSIYLGVLSGWRALAWFGLQLAWAAGLALGCAWVWSRARLRIEIQGG